MKVRDVMRTTSKSVDGHETVQAAAKRMKSEDVGCLVVDNGDQSEGIVTDRDLSVRCIGDGKDPSSTPVRDVMSVGVIDCREDEPIGAVIEKMIGQGVLRLPVRDRDGKVVGLISARESGANSADVEAVTEPVAEDPLRQRYRLQPRPSSSSPGAKRLRDGQWRSRACRGGSRRALPVGPRGAGLEIGGRRLGNRRGGLRLACSPPPAWNPLPAVGHRGGTESSHHHQGRT